MRLCRFEHNGEIHIGAYDERRVTPLERLARRCGVDLPRSESLLDYLPHGRSFEAARALSEKLADLPGDELARHGIDHDQVRLLVPIPRPNKLMLLAGNYAEHIKEGGGIAAERARTFPYVFMKPPTTTLTNPGDPVRIPAVSPDHIDWEIELGVVIGRRCKGVKEKEALQYVAGYTVVNDISDRHFKPNPNRVERPKDAFFDWLHGKWHDTFCPVGPCITPASEIRDPQNLRLTLKVNGHVEQDSNTRHMIFPVAAVIEFISAFVTLEPGDIISTGTPSGVGAAKGKFLQPGDRLDATIERIGTLSNPVE